MFLFNHTAPSETYTLSLHDALPIFSQSIREETQNRLAALALLDAFLAALAEPQRRARRLEPFDRPVLRGDEERMRVTSVRVREHTVGRMNDRVAEREKHLRLRQLLR